MSKKLEKALHRLAYTNGSSTQWTGKKRKQKTANQKGRNELLLLSVDVIVYIGNLKKPTTTSRTSEFSKFPRLQDKHTTSHKHGHQNSKHNSRWAFDIAAQTTLWKHSPHIRVPMFKFWLHSQFQFPVYIHTGKQQVMVQELGSTTHERDPDWLSSFRLQPSLAHPHQLEAWGA